MDGECVHAAREFGCKRLIDHAVAFNTGLSLECVRYNIDPIVSLPARPVPGMAFVLVGFVHHLEALRRESLGQLSCDEIGSPHNVRLGECGLPVNSRKQVLNASPARAHNVRS